MTSPRVTIGVPVCNGENYLEEALGSQLAQSWSDLEIVISDNASTDATEEICRRVAARDERVKYVRQPVNLGAAANYNRLVEMARGELFRWAPHDDLSAPDHIEKLIDALDAAGPSSVLAYPDTEVIDESGATLEIRRNDAAWDPRSPASRLDSLLRQPHGLLHKCDAAVGLVRTSVLARTRGIGSFPGADKVLIAELALLGDFVRVPEPLFRRRVHDGIHRRANADSVAVAAWFDPARRGDRIGTPRCDLARGYASAALAAPIPISDRARCGAVVCRWLTGSRNWRVIVGEARRAASARLGLSQRSVSPRAS